jgi:RNA polymerase sigma factor (sigma-70 family)
MAMELSKSKKTGFDEGSLDLYLKEISRYPLITRDEEARLARGLRNGDREALDKLCRSNLRFVVSVAKKYQNQGVALSDLINEGNLGLIRAAHKFDETKGIKFISYAVWWIRQAILQALAEQSRIVRVPLNRAGTLHRIGRRSNALLQELGREPSAEEIAKGMDISIASSACVASRPSSCSMELAHFPSLCTAPARLSGTRTIRDCSASAWRIACRIHHTAYEMNLMPLVSSNLCAARMRPRLPSLIRSESDTP